MSNIENVDYDPLQEELEIRQELENVREFLNYETSENIRLKKAYSENYFKKLKVSNPELYNLNQEISRYTSMINDIGNKINYNKSELKILQELIQLHNADQDKTLKIKELKKLPNKSKELERILVTYDKREFGNFNGMIIDRSNELKQEIKDYIDNTKIISIEFNKLLNDREKILNNPDNFKLAEGLKKLELNNKKHNDNILSRDKALTIIDTLNTKITNLKNSQATMILKTESEIKNLKNMNKILEEKKESLVDPNSDEYRKSIEEYVKNKQLVIKLEEEKKLLEKSIANKDDLIKISKDIENKLRSQLLEAESNRDKIKLDLDISEEKLKESKEQVNTLTVSVQEAERELTNLRTKLSDLEDKKNKEINNYSFNFSDKQKQIALLEAQLGQTNKSINDLVKENLSLHEQYKNEYNTKLSDIESNYSSSILKLQDEIKRLEESLKDASDNTDNIIAQRDNLRKEYDDYQLAKDSEIDQINIQYRQKFQEIAELENNIDQLTRERNVMSNALKLNKDEYDTLLKNFTNLKIEYNNKELELQSKINELENSINIIDSTKRQIIDIGTVDPNNLVIEDVFNAIMNTLNISQNDQDDVLNVIKQNTAAIMQQVQAIPGLQQQLPAAQQPGKNTLLKNIITSVMSDTLNDIKKMSSKLEFESTKERQQFRQQFESLRSDIEREKNKISVRQFMDHNIPEKKPSISEIEKEIKKIIPEELSGKEAKDSSQIYILGVQVFETEKEPFNKIPLSESSGNIDSVLLKYPSNIVKKELGKSDNPVEELLINVPILPCKYQYYEVGTDDRYNIDIGDIVDEIYHMNGELPDLAKGYLQNGLIDEDDYETIIDVYNMQNPKYDYYDDINRIFYERSKLRWDTDEFKSGIKTVKGIQFMLSDQLKKQGYVKHICINDKIERDKYYYFIVALKNDIMYNDLIGYNIQQADNDAKLEIIDSIKYQSNYYKGIRRMYALSVYYNDHNKRKLTDAVGAKVNGLFKTLGVLENIIILKENNIQFKLPNLKKQVGKIVSMKNIEKIYDEIYDKMNVMALHSLTKMKLIPIPAEYAVINN